MIVVESRTGSLVTNHAITSDIPEPSEAVTKNDPDIASNEIIHTKKPTDKFSTNSYHELLEEFTVSTDDELFKIGHQKLFKGGVGNPKYKCLKCGKSSLYFSDAESHNMEHELEETKHIRSTLKSAELDRQKDAKTLSKIGKLVGKVDKKKILIVLNKVVSNLEMHSSALLSLADEKMPNQLRTKHKQFSDWMAKTLEKGVKIRNKITN